MHSLPLTRAIPSFKSMPLSCHALLAGYGLARRRKLPCHVDSLKVGFVHPTASNWIGIFEGYQHYKSTSYLPLSR